MPDTESEIVSLLREIRDIQHEQLKSHLESVARIELRQKDGIERTAAVREENRLFREQVLKDSETSKASIRRAGRTTWIMVLTTWAILAIFFYFVVSNSFLLRQYPRLP